MSNTSILRYRDQVENRLQGEDCEADELLRWFRRLERWFLEEQDTTAEDWPDVAAAVANTKTRIMEAMSETLPRRGLPLTRIMEFDVSRLDEKRLQNLSGGQYGPPIVVLGDDSSRPVEVLLGRHRVTAARRDGAPWLWAVYVPRLPGE